MSRPAGFLKALAWALACIQASSLWAGGLADIEDARVLNELAAQSGACGNRGVASASIRSDGALVVTCNEDASAFVPLAGGLAPALGAAALAALLGAISDGSTTSDTR